ncbi:MAG TPA: histidinol dehydrogenase [Bacteroidia bacterium]|nr:histidinol dehydrogenase [Bacteroidia bacterium]
MKVFAYPAQDKWVDLVKRPTENYGAIEESVKSILKSVENRGDKALIELTKKFDKIAINNLKVNANTTRSAKKEIPARLKNAIDTAYKNIYAFHATQVSKVQKIETTKGVICWRKSIGIEKVGLYIPGGSAPLFSTVLMLGIPAQIAGCKEVILCTPPDKTGAINPAILYAADKCGIKNIYMVGGAQAIAAMAYGTKAIAKVDKIFGPGNSYVMIAKQLVSLKGVAIDMPAGPSEVLVIADDSADASFVAADLLSQAEHGPDSQVILVSTSKKLAEEVNKEIAEQLKVLPRKAVAEKALNNSSAILLKNLDSAIDFSNLYAPEHLILSCSNGEKLAEKVINAGSVFIGNYTPESAGDYASGTNHTLPTNGYARAYSGVSVDSFVRKVTFQKITPDGLVKLGSTIEIMAEAEQLQAHKNAVTIRLNSIKKKKNV